MTSAQVEAYLHRHIPLSAAMGVRVPSVSADEVTLQVPLEPNLNHQDTAFGGSVAALAILAGWTLVHFRLREDGFETRTVIQSSDVRYDAPIDGPFEARCRAPEAGAWRRFTRTLQRRGKARIRVRVVLSAGGEAAGRFEGAYVAILG